MSESDQLVANLIGMCLAALIGGWVAADAKRRGLKDPAAFGWGVGVFFILIFFLPLYLYLRKREKWTIQSGPDASSAVKECPYCGYKNGAGANYCAKCDRQLRSSGEIHRKGGE